MKHLYFEALEQISGGTTLELDDVINQLAFNENGLIPVITQDFNSKEVLMMAWMNKQSISETLSVGHMVYWSRSRQELWRKGETSGHTQKLIEMSFDCDGDAILCRVDQKGPACHTGRPSCFYLKVGDKKVHVPAAV